MNTSEVHHGDKHDIPVMYSVNVGIRRFGPKLSRGLTGSTELPSYEPLLVEMKVSTGTTKPKRYNEPMKFIMDDSSEQKKSLGILSNHEQSMKKAFSEDESDCWPVHGRVADMRCSIFDEESDQSSPLCSLELKSLSQRTSEPQTPDSRTKLLYQRIQSGGTSFV